jgi:hypothetical protein
MLRSEIDTILAKQLSNLVHAQPNNIQEQIGRRDATLAGLAQEAPAL